MSNNEKSLEQVIEEHKKSGKFFQVGKIEAFALDYGDTNKTEAVLCLHGVPTSSFLYRKVLKSLAKNGHRAVSIDFPGLGLSEKPADYDYSFHNFSDFVNEATKVLNIEKCHLVVHDMGGPIGFAFAAQNPDKIASLSILNTWIDVVNFTKPLVMKPFENAILGEAELKLITHATWSVMFSTMGVNNSEMIPAEEINAYVNLLKHKDNGAAFLKIMRNYNNSEEFRDLCLQAVQNVSYPLQIIWGAEDPALTMGTYGKEIQSFSGIKKIEPLFSRHLLQEEVWGALSIKLDNFIKNG